MSFDSSDVGASDDGTSPEIQRELEILTRQFQTISDAFQHHALEIQPLETQRRLTRQTREIFGKYVEHGSLDRLSRNVRDFLEGKMDRRPGEAELEVRRFETSAEVDLFGSEGEDEEEDDDDEEEDDDDEEEDDDDEEEEEEDIEWEDDDDDDDEEDKEEKEGDFPFHLFTSPDSPTSNHDNDDNDNDGGHHKFPALEPASTTPRTRSHDPESNHLVTHLPFHAVDSTLTFAAEQSLPPAYVAILSDIFALFDAEGRALLRHHTTKYGPEPIFRVGIRELLTSRLEDLVKSPADHDLGLATETRELLREVYEQCPRGGGGGGGSAAAGEGGVGVGELNDAELRILSGVCGIGQESVEEFWADMHVRRRAVGGMRVLIARKELEKVQAERNSRVQMQNQTEIAGNVWTGGDMDVD